MSVPLVKKYLKLNLIYLLIFSMLVVLIIYAQLDFYFPFYKLLVVVFLSGFLLVNLSQDYFFKVYVNLLLCLASATSVIIISDSILRVALKSNLYYRPQEMFGNRMPEYPHLLSRFDKNITWEGHTFGDLAAMSGVMPFREQRTIRFQTDLKGYRNEPNQKNKNNQIIIIGDSFGVGSGTHQDSTFAVFLLQDKEVYNMSYPGNPLQALANLIVDYDDISHVNNPTVLWLLFTGNDLPNSIEKNADLFIEMISKNQFKESKQTNNILIAITKLKTYIKRSPIRQLLAKVRRGKNTNIVLKDFPGGQKMYFYNEYVRASKLSKDEIVNQPGYPSLKSIFHLANEFANTKKFNLKVVLIPTKYEIYKWVYDDKPAWEDTPQPSGYALVLASIFNDLGIDYINSKNFLLDYAKQAFHEKKKILWWFDDTHLNVEGHRALSELIQKHI